MTDTPGALEERLRGIAHNHVAPGDIGRNTFAEAADEIASLRARVEAAEADAATARQGYQTAYNEFDKKCRTINRLVCEKIAMRKALEQIKGCGFPAVEAIARQALKDTPDAE